MPTILHTCVPFSLIILAGGAAAPPARIARRHASCATVATPLRTACWKIFVLATRMHEVDEDATTKIAAIINASGPPVLRGIAIWAMNRARAQRDDGHCPVCERYEAASYEAISTLSGRDNEQAARLLVSLLIDKAFSGHAHATETLYEAISHMGKRTLPYLEPLRTRNEVARNLIDELRKRTPPK